MRVRVAAGLRLRLRLRPGKKYRQNVTGNVKVDTLTLILTLYVDLYL